MGNVIPFRLRAACVAASKPLNAPSGCTTEAERAVKAAVDSGGDRRAVMAAATPLTDECRDRYGFTIMLDGMPSSPAALADALITLTRGLALLEAEFGRPFWTFGVYFGQEKLTWFDDGYGGSTALAVPADFAPAQFVLPRLQSLRR
jgi:hypothetical protein